MERLSQQFKRISLPRLAVAAILALCAAWGLGRFLDPAASEAGRLLRRALGFLCCFALLLFPLPGEKRARRVLGGFSFLLSLALVMGKAVSDTNMLIPMLRPARELMRTLAILAGFTAFFTALLARALAFLEQRPLRGRVWSERALRRAFFLNWLLIFLSWLPALLAYYPGIYSYDVVAQTGQAVTGRYSRILPPLHTWLWSLFLKLGGRVGVEPLLLYSLAQMLALSAILAAALRFLMRRGVSLWLQLAALAFFALNPATAILSMAMTKDVLFAGLFVLVVLLLLERSVGGGKGSGPGLALTALAAGLMRSNIIYAALLWLPAALGKRERRRRTALPLGVGLALFFLVNNGLYPALGVGDGSSAELLSVPMQQIANAVVNNYDGIAPGEREETDRYFYFDGLRWDYNPRFADPVKLSFRTENFDTDRAGFFSLWLRLLRSYPGEYVNAALALNLPYWYPLAETPDPYSQRIYIETGMYNNEYYAVERASRAPGLLALYERAADYSAFRERPLLNTLFSPSTPPWALLLCLTLLLARGKKETAAALGVPLGLWILYLFGPVSNFRYMFPLFLLYPLLLCLILQPERWESGGNLSRDSCKTGEEMIY